MQELSGPDGHPVGAGVLLNDLLAALQLKQQRHTGSSLFIHMQEKTNYIPTKPATLCARHSCVSSTVTSYHFNSSFFCCYHQSWSQNVFVFARKTGVIIQTPLTDHGGYEYVVLDLNSCVVYMILYFCFHTQMQGSEIKPPVL